MSHSPERTQESAAEASPSRAKETIFTAERAEHDVSWDESPEAVFRDALALLAPELTPAQTDALTQELSHESPTLDAIRAIVHDAALARRIGKCSDQYLGRPVLVHGIWEQLRYGATTSGMTDTGLGLRRALAWQSANTHRTDLRVTYPASGADATGFLDHLTGAPIAHLDCVTAGGPQGADRKAASQDIDTTLVKSTIQQALEQQRIAPADCVVLDSSGFGVLMDLADPTVLAGALDRLVVPGGILVTTSGYLGAGRESVKHVLTQLPPERYRYVGHQGGNVFIVERTRTTSDATTST
ncbi:hypothetical protein HYV74_01435 [Candidatus Uhrbacteria bacterium]|nr:hypothetical protein [Candidatus Uhrbacteria bacterium]